MGGHLALLFKSYWKWLATGKNSGYDICHIVRMCNEYYECEVILFWKRTKDVIKEAETHFLRRFAYNCFVLWGTAKTPAHQYQNTSRFMRFSWNLEKNFQSSLVGTLEKANLPERTLESPHCLSAALINIVGSAYKPSRQVCYFTNICINPQSQVPEAVQMRSHVK